MQTARGTPGNYGSRFDNVLMAFEITESGEDEDYYDVTLSFRPEGDSSGKPGEEQFFIAKEGEVAHRQVLSQPKAGRKWALPLALLTVVGVIAIVVVVAVAGANSNNEAPVDLRPTIALLSTPADIPAVCKRRSNNVPQRR